LKIYPDHEWLNHDLAVVYKNNGNYDESIRLFKHLTAMRPRQEWHTIGLANTYIEQGLYREAATVYENYEQIQDICTDCHPALIVYFNHSLLLSRMGKKLRARQAMLQAINDPRIERQAFEPSMWQIIDFYLGTISADSIEQVMAAASQKLQRQSFFISHYFYLSLAYLYNLRPGFILAPTYREKAIRHLQKYISGAIKSDVEFSLARVELKRLGAFD
jgi:lipoprotein NlpI